jgi:hypothetical protein
VKCTARLLKEERPSWACATTHTKQRTRPSQEGTFTRRVSRGAGPVRAASTQENIAQGVRGPIKLTHRRVRVQTRPRRPRETPRTTPTSRILEEDIRKSEWWEGKGEQSTYICSIGLGSWDMCPDNHTQKLLPCSSCTVGHRAGLKPDPAPYCTGGDTREAHH